MTPTENCASAQRRQRARSITSTRLTAATSSSTVSARKPTSPSRTISGTAPHGRATTGVPHASASIIASPNGSGQRSEEHTSELQSLAYLVCRLLLEKKKRTQRPFFLTALFG